MGIKTEIIKATYIGKEPHVIYIPPSVGLDTLDSTVASGPGSLIDVMRYIFKTEDGKEIVFPESALIGDDLKEGEKVEIEKKYISILGRRIKEFDKKVRKLKGTNP